MEVATFIHIQLVSKVK